MIGVTIRGIYGLSTGVDVSRGMNPGAGDVSFPWDPKVVGVKISFDFVRDSAIFRRRKVFLRRWSRSFL